MTVWAEKHKKSGAASWQPRSVKNGSPSLEAALQLVDLAVKAGTLIGRSRFGFGLQAVDFALDGGLVVRQAGIHAVSGGINFVTGTISGSVNFVAGIAKGIASFINGVFSACLHIRGHVVDFVAGIIGSRIDVVASPVGSVLYIILGVLYAVGSLVLVGTVAGSKHEQTQRKGRERKGDFFHLEKRKDLERPVRHVPGITAKKQNYRANILSFF